MKQKVSIFAVGLFVGLVVGFIVTNHFNRPEFAVGKPGSAAANSASTPGGNASQGDGPIDPSGGDEAQISDEELQHIKQAVDANPDKYDDQVMFAEYLLKMRHDPAAAIAYYERANKLKPNDLKSLVGLANATFDAAAPEDGTSAYDDDRLKKATGYYEKALAIDPKDVNVRTDMALTYFFRTPPETDRAIAEFRRSLAIDPRHQITLQNLTAALTTKGDLQAAEQTLAQLQSVAPGNPAIPQLRADIEKARSGQKIPSH